MSAPTQPLADEIDRCKVESCIAGGEAFAALTQADVQGAERHFARAARLLQMAMDMHRARRLLDRNDEGEL